MNIVQEKDSKICIAYHLKTILCKNAEYRLWQWGIKEYLIEVKYEGECARLCMFCDFFNAAELYRLIVKTDTLPGNLEEISTDISCDGILSKLM